MLIAIHALSQTQPIEFSPDSWTLVADSTFGTTDIQSAATDGLTFVAVGNSGKLASSQDPVVWTARTSSFGTSSIYAVAYGDGKFIAGGSSGKMAVSTDGETWTQVSSSSFGSSVILTITYSAALDLWIAAGGSGKLATSPDGVSWTQRTSSFGTTFIRCVYASNNMLVAVGDSGKLATSVNGTSWIQRSSSFSTTDIYHVDGELDGTHYIAVGDSGKIGMSLDGGNSWSQVFPTSTFGSTPINAIRRGPAGESPFLAGGSAGKVATSVDGNNWTQRDSKFGTDNINDVVYSTNVGLIVGNSGKIAYAF